MPINSYCCTVIPGNPCNTASDYGTACPPIHVGSYVVHLPSVITFNMAAGTDCSPSDTSVTVLSATCVYNSGIGALCVAGHQGFDGVVGQNVEVALGSISCPGGNNAAFWNLQFDLSTATDTITVSYFKPRTSTTDTPVGTYTFYELASSIPGLAIVEITQTVTVT